MSLWDLLCIFCIQKEMMLWNFECNREHSYYNYMLPIIEMNISTQSKIPHNLYGYQARYTLCHFEKLRPSDIKLC